jgi:GH43 family beta-xylosidase
MRSGLGRFFKSFVSVWLTLSCILPLYSCSNQSNDTDQVDTTVTSRLVEVVTNGETAYQIVRPSSLSKSSVSVYSELKTQISVSLSVYINMVKDTTDVSDYEILIGHTNRSLSEEAYQNLGTDQFSFTSSGNSIAIAASNDQCMALAIEKFIELYVTDSGLTFDAAQLPQTFQCGTDYTEVTVDNTADIEADDPYVINHNGNYYYCWSNGGVRVAKISNLNSITKENGVLVFDRTKYDFYSVWAPELHYINGEWYIYVAMCKGSDDNAKHRMYVLKGTSQDPTDEFELVGQITDSTDKWAIDGTVFTFHDELYFVWSGWPGDSDGQQNLYIAHMSDPTTIDSPRVQISTATSWDKVTTNPTVNEGPCVIVEGETVFILYSGNGSWTDDYCIGYLRCTNGDLLTASSWEKSKKSILYKTEKAYGPGHCSVTQADDGSYWIIYHANLVSGSGWSGRSVRIQPLTVSETSITRANPELSVSLPIGKKYILDDE